MDELVKKINQWWKEASPKKRWTAIALFVAVICTILLFIITSSTQPAAETEADSYLKDFDTPLYYIGVVGKTIGVLLLIVGGAIVIKRMQKSPLRMHSDRIMSIIESTRLSPKQALHLVRIGEQYYLVGATDQNLNLISEVNPYTEAAGVEQQSCNPQAAFNEILSDTMEPEKSEQGSVIQGLTNFQDN